MAILKTTEISVNLEGAALSKATQSKYPLYSRALHRSASGPLHHHHGRHGQVEVISPSVFASKENIGRFVDVAPAAISGPHGKKPDPAHRHLRPGPRSARGAA